MSRFRRRYSLFAARIERVLFTLVVFLLLLLCLSQAALGSAELRRRLCPVEMLEGIPYRLPGEEIQQQ